MIVDVHVHLFSPEVRRRRERYAAWDPAFGAIYADPRARMAGPEELLEAMEADGVELALVCGFPWQDEGICEQENAFLLETCARFPRLLPLVTVSARAGERAVQELERCLRAGARGLGEMAPGTYGDRLELEPLLPLLEALRRWGGLLLVHVNEPVGHAYPGKGRVCLREVERLVMASRGLDLVLAHWGGGLLFYELMPELRRACERVYYDTAASPLLYRPEVFRVATMLAPERVLLGSDFPLLRPRRYLEQLEGLPDEVRRMIAGENARRLLRVDAGQADHPLP